MDPLTGSCRRIAARKRPGEAVGCTVVCEAGPDTITASGAAGLDSYSSALEHREPHPRVPNLGQQPDLSAIPSARAMNIPNRPERGAESTESARDLEDRSAGTDPICGPHTLPTASMPARAAASLPADPDEATSTPRTSRAQPPQPPTASEFRERGLGGRGRVRGHSEILASYTTVTPTGTQPAPSASRRTRVLTLRPDLVDRIRRSGMIPADLILIAAYRYAGHLQDMARSTIPGRVRFTVRLNDTEHQHLKEIAEKRGWPVSPTVAALLDLYLTEFETAQNKKPKRARAKP